MEILNLNEQLGVDFTNALSDVDLRRSPDAVNVVRSTPGKIRKRMGYFENTYPFSENGNKINGYHELRTADRVVRFFHVGTSLYSDYINSDEVDIEPWTVVRYEGMADNISVSKQLNGHLCIFDGENMIIARFKRDLSNTDLTNDDDFNNEFIDDVEVISSFESAYKPIITIGGVQGKTPEGNIGAVIPGNAYENINLLSGYVRERFNPGNTETTIIATSYPVILGHYDANGDIVKFPMFFRYLNGKGMWKTIEDSTNSTTIMTLKNYDNANSQNSDYKYTEVIYTRQFSRNIDWAYQKYLGDVLEIAYYAAFKPEDYADLYTSISYEYIYEVKGVAYKLIIQGSKYIYSWEKWQRVCKKNAEKINTCDVACLYGAAGNLDRVFCTGYKKHLNYDFYCQKDNPTYWPDLNYNVIGQDNSPIMGYSYISDNLVAHKNGSENDTNAIIRNGEVVTAETNGFEETKVIFRIKGAYQGQGAISKRSFAYLENEPVYLSKDGISAVSPSDISSERFVQLRSFFLNGKLLKEENLEGAYGLIYERMYLLLINGKVYILDGLQPVYEKNAPYSNRQYEGYYWEDINARIMWVADDNLFFGTEGGKIYEFFSDVNSEDSYSQDDEDNPTVSCAWTTPEIYGKNPYYRKNFRYVGAILNSEETTSAKILANVEGNWEVVSDYNTEYNGGGGGASKLHGEKIRVRHVDKTRFKIENDKQEPFILDGIYVEYELGSKFDK